MDFPFVDAPSAWKKLRWLWSSDRIEAARFYAGYFRWPLLLVLLALAGEKLIYYGVLPLDGYLAREWAYAEAGREDAQGDDQAATQSIRRALLETRDDARLWRLAAKISDHAHSAEAVYCWGQADRLNPGSTDTQLSLAEAALENRQPDLVESALDEVSASDRETVRFQLDAGRSSLAAGRSSQARACFERVEAALPRDAKTLFVLAAWHAGLPGPRDQDRARALLENLALRPAEHPAALRALIELDLQQGKQSDAWTKSDALLASPGAVFSDRITRLDLANRANPDTVDAQLAALLRHQTPAETAPVLEWMAAHGRGEEALIWIRHQTEEWQDDATIGTARAQCLAALADWTHLRDDQRDSRWPGQEPERLALLARACLALKDEDDARAAWNEAVGACRNADDFLALLHAADQFAAPGGWDDEKAQVWLALVRQYPGQPWPLRALLAYQLGRGDLLQAQALYARLAQLDPADLSLAANRDFISLLRGAEVEKASANLRQMEETAPGNPAVATAAAYALHLQGKDNEALAAMGALTADELNAPERAACLGQLLAAAGPVDRAEACLKIALTQPHLLAEERAGVERALDLVAYRRAMADLLHAPVGPVHDRSAAFFAWRAPSGAAVFTMGQSVALSLGGDTAGAAKTLAPIEPATLDSTGLSIYEGAAFELTGNRAEAARYLELADDLPTESSAAKLHRALENWWALVPHGPLANAATTGLLATYRALETVETDPAFWPRDAGRELTLTRDALLRDTTLSPAVTDRLEALVRHIPTTPQIEAQIGYALFRQGRVQAARARLEILPPAELAQPEAAFYYGTILQASGETKKAADYLRLAGALPPAGEPLALQRTSP